MDKTLKAIVKCGPVEIWFIQRYLLFRNIGIFAYLTLLTNYGQARLEQGLGELGSSSGLTLEATLGDCNGRTYEAVVAVVITNELCRVSDQIGTTVSISALGG